MTSRPVPRTAGVALVAAVGLERLAELRLSTKNADRSLAAGGVESGQGHYPAMVALHSGLLVACLVEPWWRGRGPGRGRATAGTVGVVAAQALRWWCIRSLGTAWTTRVIVVPGTTRVVGGPYRWFAHPNYTAVVLEGAALPLAVGAPVTAAGFTALNGWLLRTRLRAENAALAALAPPTTTSTG